MLTEDVGSEFFTRGLDGVIGETAFSNRKSAKSFFCRGAAEIDELLLVLGDGIGRGPGFFYEGGGLDFSQDVAKHNRWLRAALASIDFGEGDSRD